MNAHFGGVNFNVKETLIHPVKKYSFFLFFFFLLVDKILNTTDINRQSASWIDLMASLSFFFHFSFLFLKSGSHFKISWEGPAYPDN